MQKYGHGQVTEVEKTEAAKTAAKDASFTEEDAAALAEENAEADG